MSLLSVRRRHRTHESSTAGRRSSVNFVNLNKKKRQGQRSTNVNNWESTQTLFLIRYRNTSHILLFFKKYTTSEPNPLSGLPVPEIYGRDQGKGSPRKPGRMTRGEGHVMYRSITEVFVIYAIRCQSRRVVVAEPSRFVVLGPVVCLLRESR